MPDLRIGWLDGWLNEWIYGLVRSQRHLHKKHDMQPHIVYIIIGAVTTLYTHIAQTTFVKVQEPHAGCTCSTWSDLHRYASAWHSKTRENMKCLQNTTRGALAHKRYLQIWQLILNGCIPWSNCWVASDCCAFHINITCYYDDYIGLPWGRWRWWWWWWSLLSLSRWS